VLGRRSFRLTVVIGGATIAAATAAGVVFAAQLVTGPRPAVSHARLHRVTTTPPSASEVAQHLVGVSNAHAMAIGSSVRIGKASCVEGDPGNYACSYVRGASPNARVCAIAMLRWTPKGASTYTVLQSGRVDLAPAECGPVTKVLHVLGTS